MPREQQIAYKIPAEVVERHREFLSGHNWRGGPLNFDLMPGRPDILTGVELEIISRDGQQIVRARTAAGANRLRKYADSLQGEAESG
jgi:hypothetical protein